MLTCPNCGRENPEDFKFCAECGTALGAEAVQARELRKLVTVVFADITGSTALGEQVDPELLRRVLERYFEEMRRILEHHGGTVEKFIGDAIMAVFGIPHLHEDDALRAVRATAEMRDRLAELNEQLAIDYGMRLQARMGVASGEVVAGDPGRGDWFVTGDAVNVAERLERSAAPDEIVVAKETCRLVRDAVEVEPLEPLTVKGKAEPLSACRLLKVTPGAPAHERRSDSPMVGRMGEFELLRQAFGRAVSERACHFFTVLGAAGVGKSRLLSEFLDEVEPKATILTGRCLAYAKVKLRQFPVRIEGEHVTVRLWPDVPEYTWDTAVSWVIFFSAFASAVFIGIIAVLEGSKTRLSNARLRAQVRRLQQEIETLRRPSLDVTLSPPHELDPASPEAGIDEEVETV